MLLMRQIYHRRLSENVEQLIDCDWFDQRGRRQIANTLPKPTGKNFEKAYGLLMMGLWDVNEMFLSL